MIGRMSTTTSPLATHRLVLRDDWLAHGGCLACRGLGFIHHNRLDEAGAFVCVEVADGAEIHCSCGSTAGVDPTITAREIEDLHRAIEQADYAPVPDSGVWLCRCGHLGNTGGSDHRDIADMHGRGRCIVPGCGCRWFSWYQYRLGAMNMPGARTAREIEDANRRRSALAGDPSLANVADVHIATGAALDRIGEVVGVGRAEHVGHVPEVDDAYRDRIRTALRAFSHGDLAPPPRRPPATVPMRGTVADLRAWIAHALDTVPVVDRSSHRVASEADVDSPVRASARVFFETQLRERLPFGLGRMASVEWDPLRVMIGGESVWPVPVATPPETCA